MSGKTRQRPERGLRPAVLGAFLLIQAFAAVFFVSDAVSDLADPSQSEQVWFEVLVAVALMSGAIFGALELRRAVEHVQQQETALATASGDLARVITTQFAAWRLTPAEKDVAYLALKGFDVAEIAGMRKAASGTVRAQLSSIYAKAGVSGRAQFAAFFVEDLLADGLGTTAADPARAVDALWPRMTP